MRDDEFVTVGTLEDILKNRFGRSVSGTALYTILDRLVARQHVMNGNDENQANNLKLSRSVRRTYAGTEYIRKIASMFVKAGFARPL
jgi:hypothetical protein